MKKVSLVIVCLLCAGTCLGQMASDYDSYETYSLDDNYNVYQTVVVDGTTTGSCYYWYGCGPHGQMCQGTWPNCLTALHTPGITNVIGGNGGSTTGTATNPFSYMSYQTTNSVQLQPGQSTSASIQGSVTCSTIGSFFAGPWKTPTISLRTAVYSLTSVMPNGMGVYTLACPPGTTATCGTANYLGSQAHLWAIEFSIHANPGGCFFLNFVRYKDTLTPAPFTCT